MTQRSNPVPYIPTSAEIRAERRRIQKRARRGRIACLVVCVLILLLAIVLLIASVVLRRSASAEGADAPQVEESIQVEDAVPTEEITPTEESLETESLGSENIGENDEETAPDLSTTGSVQVSTYLNLRSGGSMEDEIIGHLLPEDQVTVIEEENGWYKVIVSEVVGYVSGDYLQVSGFD